MKKYIGEKVVARGYQSGVYYGELVSQEGQEVEMKNVRNLWKWRGANNLLDLAENGVSRPSDCSFSNVVDGIALTDICEIVPCSEKAQKIIEEVSSWIYKK